MRWLIVLVLTGCSFGAVRTHPKRLASGGGYRCQSYVLPTLDLAGAVSGAWVTLGIWVDEDHLSPSDVENGVEPDFRLAKVVAGIAAAALASAIYGYATLPTCNDALSRLKAVERARADDVSNVGTRDERLSTPSAGSNAGRSSDHESRRAQRNAAPDPAALPTRRRNADTLDFAPLASRLGEL